MNKELYENLKKEYGKRSSWALWADPDEDRPKSNIDCMDVFDGDVWNRLNTKYVFVGLNPSGAENANTEDWCAFHSSSPYQNDYKLRYALKDTQYWGSYITDLFIVKNSNSGEVTKKATLEEINAARDSLIAELEVLRNNGEKPTLIAMGNAVYKYLTPLQNQYTVKKITHYAYRVNKYKYREMVRKKLELE